MRDTQRQNIKRLLSSSAHAKLTAKPSKGSGNSSSSRFQVGTKSLGQLGEEFSHDYLVSNRFRILATNWRIQEGEIDIIAIKSRRIHFIEVKTRREESGFSPYDAINHKKSMRLKKLGATFLQREHAMLASEHIQAISFDLMAVFALGVGNTLQLRADHIIDAF